MLPLHVRDGRPYSPPHQPKSWKRVLIWTITTGLRCFASRSVNGSSKIDSFCNKPSLVSTRFGAQFVDGVAPWDEAKLRIVNAGHASMCYPAALLGIEFVQFVHKAMYHDIISNVLDKPMTNEILPRVPPVPNTSLKECYPSKTVVDSSRPSTSMPEDVVATISVSKSLEVIGNGCIAQKLPTLHRFWRWYVRQEDFGCGSVENGGQFCLRIVHKLQKLY